MFPFKIFAKGECYLINLNHVELVTREFNVLKIHFVNRPVTNFSFSSIEDAKNVQEQLNITVGV